MHNLLITDKSWARLSTVVALDSPRFFAPEAASTRVLPITSALAANTADAIKLTRVEDRERQRMKALHQQP